MYSGPEPRPLVAGISVEFAQEWEQSEQRPHQQRTTVAVLEIGGMHDRVQYEALRVYE